MTKLGIMLEGQEGLSWERWRRICADVERLGFASLRRSDHLISLMGPGTGERDCIECWESLALAAEWNLSRLDADMFRDRRDALDQCCREIGRDPATIHRSVMTSYIIGRDRVDQLERAAQVREVVPDLKSLRPEEVLENRNGPWLVGTPEEIAAKIREHSKLGVDLFMLQHFLLDDSDAL